MATEPKLDFSDEEPSKEKDISYTLGEEYDSRPQEDAARRNIAYLLIGLLWFLVMGIMLLTWCKVIELKDIKEFSVILGPVVALVSAATGFYYGTKSSSNGN